MTKTHFVTIFFVTSKHLRQKHFVTTRWLAATTLAQSQDQVWTVGVQGEDKSAFCNGLWNPSLYMLYSFSNCAHIQIQYLFYAHGAIASLRFPIWHDIFTEQKHLKSEMPSGLYFVKSQHVWNLCICHKQTHRSWMRTFLHPKYWYGNQIETESNLTSVVFSSF